MLFPQQAAVVGKMEHIFGVFKQSNGIIRPHFHLTGPSGSGKSYLVKKMADSMKLNFMEINAAQLTAEGLSGNSLSKALRQLREHWNEPNIIFVDEFDKLFQTNGEKTESFRSQVQDEFLTCLESKYTTIFTDYGKYEPVVINNSLFVFAGAYSNQNIKTLPQLRDAGMRTEFLGRVPLVLSTKEIPVSELIKVIKTVDLYKQYKQLYPSIKDHVAIKGITNIIKDNADEMPIGVRLLNTAIHLWFMRDI